MFAACLGHFSATLRILEPTLVEIVTAVHSLGFIHSYLGIQAWVAVSCDCGYPVDRPREPEKEGECTRKGASTR